MATLKIDGAHFIVTVDPERRIIRDGSILIEGQRIVQVGKATASDGDPVGALKHVATTLAKDGTCMLVEPFANDKLEHNLNPVGSLFYAASTMICTPACGSCSISTTTSRCGLPTSAARCESMQ